MRIHQLFTIIVIFIILYSCSSNKSTVPGELNLASMIQPIPVTAKFINDTSYIWCGTLVKSHIDKKYHLFYSRWPREYGFSAWVTSSEVAHAVSDSPFGPFEFKDVTLPHRGAEYWDGMYTHNPTVHFFNGKYYLYYAGNFGDGKITSPQLNWTHRNNQRIGVAIADDPNGPWTRFDKPLIDISADTTAHDAQMVANPSVTQMPDGRFLMVYKAVARKNHSLLVVLWFICRLLPKILKDLSSNKTNPFLRLKMWTFRQKTHSCGIRTIATMQLSRI
jgi:hypothetical protein